MSEWAVIWRSFVADVYASRYSLIPDLLVAGLQLTGALVIARWLTERWQRWRQRRDFRYGTMVKFNELCWNSRIG